jgi:ABC-2 type transport system permease protein
MLRALRLYRRCLGAHLRAVLEYEADFWILVVAGLLTQATGILFLSSVFAQVPSIHGWTLAECLLVMGLYSLAAAAGPLLIEGAWGMSWAINHGDFDYLLVRPMPIPLQVASASIGLHGVGDAFGALAMIGYGLAYSDVTWSPAAIGVGLLLVVSAITIQQSMVFAANTMGFWVRGSFPHFAVALHGVADMARFPVSIYGRIAQVAFMTAVPFAFVSFVPASWLLGRDGGGLGLLTPAVAAACVWVSRSAFRAGLRRYDSSGH